jgi:UDP-3-O-[3-hydroxymyristoyl] glucosamine N-acyltransferase
MRTWKLGELAEFLQGVVVGDPKKELDCTCAPESLAKTGILFVEKAVQLEKICNEAFGAVIVTPDLSSKIDSLAFTSSERIVHEYPKLAFAWAQIAFYAPDFVHLPAIAPLNDTVPYPLVGGEWRRPDGVNSTANISNDATLAENVEIGAFSVVDKGSSIGEGTIIYPHVYIGKNVRIGRNCRIFPNVTLYAETQIGDNVYIHSGTVVGADGYGFVTHSAGHTKLAQTGRVVIGDNVEIGANCCIDRAAITETIIESGVKLDNLIQIAHGSCIGKNTLIAAQTGVSGGMNIGSWCVIGGQVGFAGHANVGDGSIVAAQSGVFNDLPAKSRVSGYPARPHAHQLKILALTYKLPKLVEKLKFLYERVESLEENSVVNNDRIDASSDKSGGTLDKDRMV